jgi:hypothetical protein
MLAARVAPTDEDGDRDSLKSMIGVIWTVVIRSIVERNYRGDRFDHRRFSEQDHDFDRFHNRHRVFRNGVGLGAGPDYSHNDCWWKGGRPSPLAAHIGGAVTASRYY